MNRFSYYITTHFIPSNKDCNSCRDSHSVYQMYHKSMLPILGVFIKFYKAFNLLVSKLRFLALTRKIKANEYT